LTIILIGATSSAELYQSLTTKSLYKKNRCIRKATMINLDISFSDGMYALLLPCIIVEINKIKAVPDAMARVTKSGAKIAVCHHSLAPCVAKSKL